MNSSKNLITLSEKQNWRQNRDVCLVTKKRAVTLDVTDN